MKSSLLRKIVIGTFLSVPAISSVISTIHLIDLFNLGNPTWLSILLAVTFELGSVASLLAISVIDRIKTGAIWFIFFILSALQIIGNVYYSYSFTSDQLLSNPTFLTNFMDLFSFITGDEIKDVKIFLSCIIGIPIPLIALFFLKSNIDYLRPAPKETTNEEPEKINTQVQNDPAVESLENVIDQEVVPMHATQEESFDVEEDPNLDDHVIINVPSKEPLPIVQEQTQEDVQQEPLQEEISSEEEETLSSQEAVTKARSPKPMISQRRADAMSVLHRG